MMPAEQIRRVGLVVNPEKKGAVEVLRRAVRLIRKAGREVLAESATARLSSARLTVCADTRELAARCDLLLVFGGDGTMLQAARDAATTGTPLLGVNLGRLGFLTTCPARQLAQTLRRLWAGECLVGSRPLIEVQGPSKGGWLREVALNDFVISHGLVPRLIELEVRIDEELLTSYRGDGLIVSSPTGSTAYSLAAGGAVVSPGADVFALTPICPHTLSSRSVILSLKARVEVRLLSERVDTYLAADGHTRGELCPGDVLTFRRSRHVARLVWLPGSSFFATLRRKLNWSGSSDGPAG